ncbi:hypothetical protein ACIPSE_01355 [Streptomyces sp. NPDC090106]|uniref:hypothetical protein n=1 Tax=Streptomyces sp. NPDC090106 TaxID=3365946 RepID=UPI00382DC909
MDDFLSFESFFGGAKKAAHRAMDEHGRGEYDNFALQGGVAIEKLAKAVLVSMNPVYLLEMRNGNPDMLLYLGGHLELSEDKVRTVGAKDAIKRLRTLGILPPDPQLDMLIELRNGTAHTSTGDRAKSLLPAFVESSWILLKKVDIDIGDFWERWSSAVIIAVDEQRSEVERDVEIRIRQSWHRFEDRFAGLPDTARERALAQPSSTPYPFDMSHFRGPNRSHYYILATVGCPCCGGTAMLQVQPSRDTKLDPRLHMDALHCPFCLLSLESAAEVKAAGVQNPWALETPPQTVTVTGFQVLDTESED